MKIFIFYLVILLTLCYSPVNGFDKENGSTENNILVLNSYHKGFVWTDDITHGIEDALQGNINELHVEYMDTKRQFDSTYQDLLLKLIEYKHKKHNYQLVITSDNNAFNFVKKHRNRVFGEIPVVFTGVNYLQQSDLEGFSNITGINEKANIRDNIKLIQKLHPKCEKILIVTDNTITGAQLQKQVLEIKTQKVSKLPIDIIFDVSALELKKELNNLSDGTIVLFTLFFRDKNGLFFEYDEGAKMVCNNSNVPVYGTWTFSMGHGIVGGMLTNGYDQGLLAGEKALKILDGIKANDIPIEMNPPSVAMFDYNMLKKHHISQIKLPDNSTVKYRPPSFIQKHKNILLYLSLLILFLASLIIILLYAIRRVNNARKANMNSKAQLKTIIDSIPSLLYINNIEGRFLLANKAVIKLFNPSNNELNGQLLIDTYPSKKIAQQIMAEDKEVLKFPKNIHLSERSFNIGKDDIRWFKTIKIACPPELFGEPAILGTSLDITHLKATELALERAKNFAENLLETANTLIIGLDTKATITTFNRFAEELTGYTKNEVLGKNWFDTFIAKEEEDNIPKVFKNILNDMPDVSQYENYITLKNKQKKRVNWNNSIIKDDNGSITGILSIGIDVTQRNYAENETKKSENKFKSIFQNSPLGILYYNNKGIILDCNQSFINIVGSSNDKLVGLDMLNLLPDKKLVNAVRNSLHTGVGTYDDFYKSITSSKVTPVKGTFKGIKDSNGKITSGIGIIEDVSLQKNAEMEIVAANEQLTATNDELVSTTNKLTQINEQLSEALKVAKKSKDLEIANKLLIQQKEEINNTLHKLKEAQSQLIQSEKLASIGVLTSGIAHEINNPLNYIQGGKTAIELYIADHLENDAKNLDPLLEMIENGVTRAANIVQSLSHFNRKSDRFDEDLCLHSIIDNCLTMLENKLKYKVKITKDYSSSTYRLKGNEGKMHQVFLNVLSNAEQAIEKDGKISIKTNLKDNIIRIEISDTGHGISKENLKQIGDPFFTTKKAGEGTGLGISISQSILKEHNGSLRIESEHGENTTVHIVLPIERKQ